MKHGKKQSSISEAILNEAEFNFGKFYRTLEEQTESFAAQPRNPFTLADITDRVGYLFRAKAQAIWQVSGATELLQQVREVGETTGQGAKENHRRKTRKKVSGVAPAGRTLKRKGHKFSVAARKRISRAQKKRWKEWRAKQRETEI